MASMGDRLLLVMETCNQLPTRSLTCPLGGLLGRLPGGGGGGGPPKPPGGGGGGGGGGMVGVRQ